MRPLGGGPVLAAGAALLAVAWAVAPAGTPPVYDGLVVAAPYRYSCPPAGYQNPGPPGTGRQDYPTTGLQTQGAVVTTAEVDQASGAPSPQAQFLAGPGSFTIPPGATTVTVSIAARCGQSPRPPDGEVVGNIYSFTAATPAGAAVALSPQHNVNVILRGPPAGSTDLVIEQLAGGLWTRIDTMPVNDMHTFAAQQVPSLGDFALVGQAGASSNGSGRGGAGGGPPVAGLVIGGAILVTAAAAAVVALRSRPRPAPAPPPRRRPPRAPVPGGERSRRARRRRRR